MSKNIQANEALLLAIEQKDINAVRQALNDGANPNAEKSKKGWPRLDQPAIILATQKGSLEIVTSLLEAEANINAHSTRWDSSPISDYEYTTAVGSVLCSAIKASKPKIIDFLLGKGVDISKGQAIIRAVEVEDLSTIEKLHRAGADLNCFCPDMHTPLYYAVESRNIKIFQWLHEHGARFYRDYDVQDAQEINDKKNRKFFQDWFKGKTSRELVAKLKSFWEIRAQNNDIEALLFDIMELLYSERIHLGELLDERSNREPSFSRPKRVRKTSRYSAPSPTGKREITITTIEHYEPNEIAPENLVKKMVRYEIRGGCYLSLEIDDILPKLDSSLFVLGIYGSGPELDELDKIFATANIGAHLGDAQSLYELRKQLKK